MNSNLSFKNVFKQTKATGKQTKNKQETSKLYTYGSARLMDLHLGSLLESMFFKYKTNISF